MTTKRRLWSDLRPGDVWLFKPRGKKVNATFIAGTARQDEPGELGDMLVTMLYTCHDGRTDVSTHTVYSSEEIPSDEDDGEFEEVSAL